MRQNIFVVRFFVAFSFKEKEKQNIPSECMLRNIVYNQICLVAYLIEGSQWKTENSKRKECCLKN